MKTIFAFALFIVGINALPKFDTQIDFNNERLVTDSIASIIQDLSQSIRDAGLDPLDIKSESGLYELPVPVIFSAAGEVEDFLLVGLSEIVIESMSFSLLTTRLRFDIVLPSIEATLIMSGFLLSVKEKNLDQFDMYKNDQIRGHVTSTTRTGPAWWIKVYTLYTGNKTSVGVDETNNLSTYKKAETSVIFFGEKYGASLAGRFAIKNVRVIGNVRVNVGIISGISVSSMDIDFSVGDIQSALNVVVQNWNLSNNINTFLGITVPTTLNNFSNEINELIEIVALDIVNDIL